MFCTPQALHLQKEEEEESSLRKIFLFFTSALQCDATLQIDFQNVDFSGMTYTLLLKVKPNVLVEQYSVNFYYVRWPVKN